MKQNFLSWFDKKPQVAKEEHNLNANLANYLSKKSYKIIMHYWYNAKGSDENFKD